MDWEPWFRERRLWSVFDNVLVQVATAIGFAVVVCVIVYAFFVLDPNWNVGRDPDFEEKVRNNPGAEYFRLHPEKMPDLGPLDEEPAESGEGARDE